MDATPFRVSARSARAALCKTECNGGGRRARPRARPPPSLAVRDFVLRRFHSRAVRCGGRRGVPEVVPPSPPSSETSRPAIRGGGAATQSSSGSHRRRSSCLLLAAPYLPVLSIRRYGSRESYRPRRGNTPSASVSGDVVNFAAASAIVSR